MSTDYKDAIDDARLDAAARWVLRRSRKASLVSMRELATRAVEDVFCLCVTDAEDAVEGHVSTIHAALIEEVVKRTQALASKRTPEIRRAMPPD